MSVSTVPLDFSNEETRRFWHDLPEGEFVRLRQEVLEQAVESSNHPEAQREELRQINLKRECMRAKSQQAIAADAFGLMFARVFGEDGNIAKIQDQWAELGDILANALRTTANIPSKKKPN